MSTSFFVQSESIGSADSVQGPLTAKELRAMVRQGAISPTTLLSKDKVKWVAAERVQGLVLPEKAAGSDDVEYFYARNGQQHGPVDRLTLVGLAKGGKLLAADLVWATEWPDWKAAEQVEGLFVAAVPPPPPLPPREPTSTSDAIQGRAFRIAQRRLIWAVAAGFVCLFFPLFYLAVIPYQIVCLILFVRSAGGRPLK